MGVLKFKTGDLFKKDVDALVNTVNCVGVMGRGVALQFKKVFPNNFKLYKAACDQGEMVPGRMFITERNALSGPKYIINFPTKRHWRGKSRLEDIETGLVALRQDIIRLGIQSIAIPPLGSGLGGLNWADVRQRIEAALSDLDCDVIVFEPSETPDAKAMARTRAVPNMTPGRATLVTLLDRYLEGLLDPFVTLIEVHKLMYFMQEAGQPLRLQFKKHHYGPYAENLRHVLHAIEGHLISGYADGGDLPNKQIELVPGAVGDAKSIVEHDNETKARFDRVSELVSGFETPYGLELLASVHWLVVHEGIRDPEKILHSLHSWNERKQRFTPRQVHVAIERLAQTGWDKTATAEIAHSQ
ncbi:MAG: macro domain-containing protein [Rhizobiaceae bacterium]|nr:macro domain-containing protein [Rhizobiaceae bacterium]